MRRGRGSARSGLLGGLILVCACGSPPSSGVVTSASSVRTDTPSPPAASPSPTGSWQTYTDPKYGFSISYPPGFAFQDQGEGPPGGLQLYRAVDNRYLNGEPPGQVELGLYPMDADTLSAWITKHTGPSSAAASQAFYWETTANVTPTSAAGRPAISFDNSSPGGPTTLHATVFQQGSSRVVLFDWWSADQSYLETIQLLAQQMLASFQG